jgi:hypothetical protein
MRKPSWASKDVVDDLLAGTLTPGLTLAQRHWLVQWVRSRGWEFVPKDTWEFSERKPWDQPPEAWGLLGSQDSPPRDLF